MDNYEANKAILVSEADEQLKIKCLQLSVEAKALDPIEYAKAMYAWLKESYKTNA